MEQLSLNAPSTRSRLCEGYCVCTWSSTECNHDRGSFDGDAQSVLVQQEVNEVVQKVSGSDQPLRLWSEEDRRVIETPRDTLLYSFSIRLKVTLKTFCLCVFFGGGREGVGEAGYLLLFMQSKVRLECTKWQSNLAFNLVTRCDLAHYE